MLKIRRPSGRLIFNMGIAIPGKTVFLIETAPWCPILEMSCCKWFEDQAPVNFIAGCLIFNVTKLLDSRLKATVIFWGLNARLQYLLCSLAQSHRFELLLIYHKLICIHLILISLFALILHLYFSNSFHKFLSTNSWAQNLEHFLKNWCDIINYLCWQQPLKLGHW